MIDENKTLKLSVSKTKTFEGCKKKFEFAYVLKMPQKEMDYHIFGKFCHTVLELYHKSYLEGSKDKDHIVMSVAYKDAIKKYGDKMSPTMKNECYEIIHNYLKLMVENRKNNCYENVIGVEKEFKINLKENIILNGFIDKVISNNYSEVVVVDYKSTKQLKYLKNDWFQLMTYGYVLLEENPDIEKITGKYVMLRHNFAEITKSFTKEEILSVKNLYLDYADKILNETEYAPNPTKLCSYCDFQEICPAQKNEIIPNNNIFGETKW